MANTKKEVVKKTTDKTVEIKGATDDGKLKVKKKKPSIKTMEITDEPIKVDLSKQVDTDEKPVEQPKEEPKKEVNEEVKEEENIKTPVLEEITDELSEEKEETQDKKIEEVSEY